MATAGSCGGSMIGTHGPDFGTQEVAVLQEKWLVAEGPMPLGAQMSSSAFFLKRQEVLPQRGRGLRLTIAAAVRAE
jgi:hypothetical protein